MSANNKLLTAITETEDYQLKATKFLEMTKTKIDIVYLKTGTHFDDDKDPRDIYKITLERNGKKMTFNFGNSISDREHWTVDGISSGYPGAGLKPFYNEASAIVSDMQKNGKKSKPTHHPRIAPTSYDILCCLTKSDVGSFEDFCNDFGYDEDSRRAEKTYRAVVKEYEELSTLFNSNELKTMSEIS